MRNLALQLHKRLKQDGIYAGTLTIAGNVSPDSPTHSPAQLAGLFWQITQDRTAAEVLQQ